MPPGQLACGEMAPARDKDNEMDGDMTDRDLMIRPIRVQDRPVWGQLWTGYLSYYKTVLPEEVYATTFARLLSGAAGEFRGLLAVRNGVPVGLVHYLFHPGSWSAGDACYLQDLFTLPQARGTGTQPAERGAPAQPGEARADARQLSDAELRAEHARRERAAFEQVAEDLRRSIAADPALAELGRQLLIEQTPEGLRIQLVDAERQPMFALGGAAPNERARLLIARVAQAAARLPNPIAINGHTDATPFRGGSDRSNWDLSAERANATRRLLAEAGLPESRIRSVAGYAERQPLLPDQPAAAANRRVAITLLSGAPEPRAAAPEPRPGALAAAPEPSRGVTR